jgi:hypothetical protein
MVIGGIFGLAGVVLGILLWRAKKRKNDAHSDRPLNDSVADNMEP